MPDLEERVDRLERQLAHHISKPKEPRACKLVRHFGSIYCNEHFSSTYNGWNYPTCEAYKEQKQRWDEWVEAAATT